MQNISSTLTFKQAANAWLRLLRLNKPAGTLLLLWPTLTGLVLASRGLPSIKLLMIFIAGVVLMRSAGCILNDAADRNLDGHVKRTQHRPLATGEIQLSSALIACLGLLGLALVLALQLNTLALAISPLAALLTTLYPLCKRWTFWPQLILGLTFNLGILMAFADVQNQLPLPAWLLYAIAVLWTVAFDTIYAIVDRPDDERVGIKSSARWLGAYDKLFIVTVQGLVLLGLGLMGYRFDLSWPYWVGLGTILVMFIYQRRLYQSYHPALTMRAFINNHWCWLTLLTGLTISFYR